MESYWIILTLGIGFALAAGIAIGYRIARRTAAGAIARRREK